ncbi:hypothetical protein BDZ89DRAFT_481972 [Hymenopellis radicata]|nr:hypothetical protein BDZ89DRAFT_481972 [Hymenopellis radicata]
MPLHGCRGSSWWLVAARSESFARAPISGARVRRMCCIPCLAPERRSGHVGWAGVFALHLTARLAGLLKVTSSKALPVVACWGTARLAGLLRASSSDALPVVACCSLHTHHYLLLGHEGECVGGFRRRLLEWHLLILGRGHGRERLRVLGDGTV